MSGHKTVKHENEADYDEGYGEPETKAAAKAAPKTPAKHEPEMEILAVRSCCIGGTAVLRRGKTTSLPKSQAQQLIAAGYATEVR